jgi:hypothetical protein
MQKIIQISDDFWNIRGTFRIGGVLNIGTHASLVRLSDGKFVFLDSYAFSGSVARDLLKITNDGSEVSAVLNLHPFHTVHVDAMHRQFPDARHYGTARHLAKYPDLSWEQLRTEDEALHAQFSEDFQFSVPNGVDFISDDENIHFSSVLAYHISSKTIHVDDTYMYARLPFPMHLLGVTDVTRFHPTLQKALEPREKAAQDFRQWAERLNTDWGDARNLCTAHLATLSATNNKGSSVKERLSEALSNVENTLRNHEQKYG